VLARWSRGLPPERVHIVTVPPRGSPPDLLWRRFAGVLGVDPDLYDTTVTESNMSLTACEAAVLRSLNELVRGLDIPWTTYRATVKHGLAASLDRDGPRIELPESAYEWAVQWSRDAVTALRDAGYQVAGDLDELIPHVRPTGAHPDDIPGEHRAETATRMLAAVLQQLAEDESVRLRAVVSQLAKGRVNVSALRRARRGAVTRRLEDAARRTGVLDQLGAYRRRG
jgi:hypothetical protein